MMDWIDVNIGTPVAGPYHNGISERVLVYLINGIITFGWYDLDHDCWDDGEYIVDVTHWVKLTPPRIN